MYFTYLQELYILRCEGGEVAVVILAGFGAVERPVGIGTLVGLVHATLDVLLAVSDGQGPLSGVGVQGLGKDLVLGGKLRYVLASAIEQ